MHSMQSCWDRLCWPWGSTCVGRTRTRRRQTGPPHPLVGNPPLQGYQDWVTWLKSDFALDQTFASACLSWVPPLEGVFVWPLNTTATLYCVSWTSRSLGSSRCQPEEARPNPPTPTVEILTFSSFCSELDTLPGAQIGHDLMDTKKIPLDISVHTVVQCLDYDHGPTFLFLLRVTSTITRVLWTQRLHTIVMPERLSHSTPPQYLPVFFAFPISCFCYRFPRRNVREGARGVGQEGPGELSETGSFRR